MYLYPAVMLRKWHNFKIINSRIQIKKTNKQTELEAIDWCLGIVVMVPWSPWGLLTVWRAPRPGCEGLHWHFNCSSFGPILLPDWGLRGKQQGLITPGCAPTSPCPCPQPSSEELRVLSARSAAIPGVLSIWCLYLDYLCSCDSSSLRCSWASFPTAFPAPCPRDKYWSAVSLSSINISTNFPLIPARTYYSPVILSTTSSLHWVNHWVVPMLSPQMPGCLRGVSAVPCVSLSRPPCFSVHPSSSSSQSPSLPSRLSLSHRQRSF